MNKISKLLKIFIFLWFNPNTEKNQTQLTDDMHTIFTWIRIEITFLIWDGNWTLADGIVNSFARLPMVIFNHFSPKRWTHLVSQHWHTNSIRSALAWHFLYQTQHPHFERVASLSLFRKVFRILSFTRHPTLKSLGVLYH